MSISTQITVAATAETIIITAPGALRGPMGDVTPEVEALVERAELGAEQASTSAGQASSSAAQAGDSAAAAASSASNAAGSATAASEDVVAAEASKVAAGLSESAAEQSATDAAASASAAGRFIMVSATAPAQRTNNTPLQIADEWQDTINNLRMSWTGTAWVALNSSAQQLEERLVDPASDENGAALLGRGVVSITTMEDLIAIAASGRRVDLRYLNAEYASGTGLGGGEWKWDSSDCSALVASDPMRALYAAPSSAPDGSSGAFRRIFSGAMDASWFGVVYGKTVDATPGLNAATAFIKAGHWIVVSGPILLKSQWDLFGLPKECAARITVRGRIYADVGDFTPIGISGLGYHFEMAGMTRLGSARTGRPMEIRSSLNSEIHFGLVDRFAEGPIAIGVRNHYGLNGVGWVKFFCKEMNVAGQVFTATTEGTGWFNENQIHFYAQYGAHGIYLKKGEGQTARFDGNLIFKPGYEQISGICQRIEFGTRNVTVDWRIESNTGTLAFSEDESCSRNEYRGAWSVVDTKLDLRGTLTKFGAQIIKDIGDTLAFSAQQSADGTMSYQSGAAWSVNAYPNSIELRVYPSSIQGYPSRLNVKNLDGSYGYIEVVPQVTQQTVAAGTVSASVLPGIKMINLSLGLANSPLELIMPAGLENDARELRLNVASYNATSPITIKKSTGTVTAGAGVSSAGLYSLGFVSGSWRVSKIGEPYSA